MNAFGTTLPLYLGLTVTLMGFAAWMTGQAVADTWRPAGQAIVYAALLGLVDRFLAFALFKMPLLSLSGYLLGTTTLIAIALVAWRVTLVGRMVAQYPWRCKRTGLFTWRDLDPAGEKIPPEPP